MSPRNVRLDATGRAKLIDFGALCDFGTPTVLVGTPQCISPEAVRGLELDQRADLFSLGVTLYWALTANAPYAIRQLREAEAAYRERPDLPSRVNPTIPEALDRLVLSLISVNPVERPTSAAEVIERLSAIADLEVESPDHAGETYFLSSVLTAREREKGQLHQHLARTLRGQGAVVVVEGEGGMGRTRLVNEMAIDARIAGATSLRVDAALYPEANGALRALARALLQAAPAEAKETLPAHIDVLGPAFEELNAHCTPTPRSARSELSKDPIERRVRVQIPRLPPNRLREIAPRVRAICEQHGVHYRSAPWPRRLREVLGVLARLSRSAPTASRSQKAAGALGAIA